VIKIDENQAKEIATRIGFGPLSSESHKCLIIGGSPSLKGTSLGEYVDQFQGDVIRINAPANPDYVEDCGSRTDIIFRSDWCDNVYVSGSEKKIIISGDDIQSLSRMLGLSNGLYLTTGTIGIILALAAYDKVEALGFGDDGAHDAGIYVTLHPISMRGPRKSRSEQCPHDMDMEHGILSELERGQFSGRLVRLEYVGNLAQVSSRRMSCWDRFDRKVLVTFTGNKHTRVPSVLNEMRRVGMYGVEMQWQFPTPLNSLLMRSIKHDKYISHKGFFNCTMGHYRAIATAYHLGCSEALFMEDDIRFLKDTSEISRMLNSIPEDYDIATLDPSYRSWPNDELTEFIGWRERRKVNDYWAEFDRMFSMGCYALSRKGMEKFMSCYEKVETSPRDGMLRVCDHYLDRKYLGKDAKMYFARKNACVQVRMGGHSSDMNNIEGRYKRMGLHSSEYEIGNMKPFDSGDPIDDVANKKEQPHIPVRSVVNSNPVDAVFVVGNGSIDCNEELRYALRSLDKNCKFIRDVYICGSCPPWVDKSKVKFLPWKDRFDHAKDANIIDKLRYACECKGIAKKILFCSDDQFQTRECSWEDFKPRYVRVFDPGDRWYSDRKRVWHTRLRSTMLREVQRRKSAGMAQGSVYYYQPHIWMPIDRDLFIGYAKWCGYETRTDTIIASGYYNFISAKGTPDFDHAFLLGDETSIPGATHLAYNDGSYHTAIGMMRKLFPQRCRFEMGYSSEADGKAVAAEHHFKHNVSHNCCLGDGYDPSRATPGEIAEIIEITSDIRGNSDMDSLLSEISRAEELRLFGVKGWRIVWRDIVSRYDTARASLTSVAERSDAAKEVVEAYLADPNGMRTVTFGLQGTGTAASGGEWREKVRASLRR